MARRTDSSENSSARAGVVARLSIKRMLMIRPALGPVSRLLVHNRLTIEDNYTSKNTVSPSPRMRILEYPTAMHGLDQGERTKLRADSPAPVPVLDPLR